MPASPPPRRGPTLANAEHAAWREEQKAPVTYESIYRVGRVAEPFPNDCRHILTAVGAPVQVITQTTQRRKADGGWGVKETSKPDTGPTCPDRGGKIVWAEAGNVRGWRQCASCMTDFVTDLHFPVDHANCVLTCPECGQGLPPNGQCPACQDTQR